MGNRWSRSWLVAKQSLAVLRGNPELMGFPIVSGIATLMVTITFFVPAFLAFRGYRPHDSIPPAWYAVLAVYYLISYFVVIFFNVGMVACTHEALAGRRMTFGQGLSHAGRHLGPILGWTLLSATVGLVLQIVSDRMGLIGKILVGLIGGAWNIITYFVIPVIAIEDKGPITAVKESGSMLRRTWGEQLIGEGGIGLAVGLFALIPLPIIVLAIVSQITAAIVASLLLSLVFWLILATISASLSGIYRTALFVYANSGQAPTAFSQDAITAAFRSKNAGKTSKGFWGR